MLRPVTYPVQTFLRPPVTFRRRLSDDWQPLDSAEALAALGWLSLSDGGEPVDVDRDICRLALVRVEKPDDLNPPARRLM